MSERTRFYYDTEFHEDGSRIDLVSIGIVRQDGAEYYAVSREFDTAAVRAHPWLRPNVWAQLPLVRDPNTPDDLERAALDVADPLVRDRTTIREQVHSFLTSAGEPRLYAWYSAYDHVALAQLWGTMKDMPDDLPFWSGDLKELHDQLGSPDLPEQAEGNHHSLHDARHDRAIHEHLMKHVAERLRPRPAA